VDPSRWDNLEIPLSGHAYALASYLIVKRQAAAYTLVCTQCYGYGGVNYSWWSEDGAKIGLALSDTGPKPTSPTGLWVREYTNAIAVVNPSSQHLSYVLPTRFGDIDGVIDLFPNANHTLDGNVLELPPLNGTVLLRHPNNI
jgi:hypothetical protein